MGAWKNEQDTSIVLGPNRRCHQEFDVRPSDLRALSHELPNESASKPASEALILNALNPDLTVSTQPAQDQRSV